MINNMAGDMEKEREREGWRLSIFFFNPRTHYLTLCVSVFLFCVS